MQPCIPPPFHHPPYAQHFQKFKIYPPNFVRTKAYQRQTRLARFLPAGALALGLLASVISLHAAIISLFEGKSHHGVLSFCCRTMALRYHFRPNRLDVRVYHVLVSVCRKLFG